MSRAFKSGKMGAGLFSNYAWMGAMLLGKTGFAITTFALVTFMPLVMVSGRAENAGRGLEDSLLLIAGGGARRSTWRTSGVISRT